MFYTEEDVRAGLPEREMASGRPRRRLRDGGLARPQGRQPVLGQRDPQPDPGRSRAVVGFVKVARDLTERREQEQLVQRQRDEILELSTPVIQVWDKVLVLPVIGTLDSMRAARLTEGLLERIARTRPRW